MFTGRVQTLSRVLQVVFILSFIIIVFFMLFDRNEIETGRTYDLLEGSFVAKSIADIEEIDGARRTPRFNEVIDKLDVQRSPSKLRVLVVDRKKSVCQIESEQLSGFVSCQSIIK